MWAPSNWAFPVMSSSKVHCQNCNVSLRNAVDHPRCICYVLLDALEVTLWGGDGEQMRKRNKEEWFVPWCFCIISFSYM